MKAAPSLKLPFEYEPDPAPVLRDYDAILINSSAGKDSQAMTDYVCQEARAAGVLRRVTVVHADLGKVEWPGVPALAREHADHYGVSFEIVRREQELDLLAHVEKRGMFPGPGRLRYCTSDHKRGPVQKLITEIAQRVREQYWINYGRQMPGVPRILNCLGMRAEESPGRAKLTPFGPDESTSSRRTVDRWLPLFRWSAEEVWARIRSAGTRHHYAYDLGMPRLSCCFCFYAQRDALLLSGLHNRTILDEYVSTEIKTGHRFKDDLALAEIAAALDAGEVPGPVKDWKM